MLCDRHIASLNETLDYLVLPFALTFAVAMTIAVAIVIGAFRRNKFNVSLCLSLAMTIGWLLYPIVPLFPAWQHGVGGISVLFTGFFVAGLGQWLASPLLIGLCVVAWKRREAAEPVFPSLIFVVGLMSSWLWLNGLTTAC